MSVALSVAPSSVACRSRAFIDRVTPPPDARRIPWVALACAVGLLVVLAVLVAVLVRTRGLVHLDMVGERRLREAPPAADPLGASGRFYPAALAVAELGDGQVVGTIAVLMCAATALATRAWRVVWCSALMLGIGVGAVEGSKHLLGRQPPLTPGTDSHLFGVPGGLSFPSGHSAGTLVVFGLVAALLSGPAGIRPRRRAHAGLTVAACVVSATVGTCTVVVGWHWPTDVLGGWLLGGALLLGINVLLGAGVRDARNGRQARSGTPRRM